MVKIAYDDVVDAVLRCEQRERDLCERFCQLNPEHRKERERMRDWIIDGIREVQADIALKAARLDD